MLLVVAGACSSDSVVTQESTSTSDRSTAAPLNPSTSSTTTMSPSTTTASTTTTTASTTTTTAVSEPSSTGSFEPACTDRPGGGGTPSTVDDASLERFDTLAVSPALRITAPAAVADWTEADDAPYLGATRVPGGFLVTVTASPSAFFDGSILAAVDLDGAVRWVRCSDWTVRSVVVADLTTAPTEVIVGMASMTEEATSYGSYRWERVSLADGADLGTLDELIEARLGADVGAHAALVFARDDVAVFGPSLDHVVDADADRLVRFDIPTMQLTEFIVPSEFAGHTLGELELEIGADGRLLRMGLAADLVHRVPNSILVDGAWSTDVALLKAAWPPAIGYAWGGTDLGLESWDATGAVLWHRSDVLPPMREGFAFAADGAMVVAATCASHDPVSGACVDDRLVGLDAESGRTRWELPGLRLVGVVADGRALITDAFEPMLGLGPTEWMLIDTTSGRELAASERWQGMDTFRTGCCGESDYLHTFVHGGVVVAVNGRHMVVWLPPALTPAEPVEVSLP